MRSARSSGPCDAPPMNSAIEVATPVIAVVSGGPAMEKLPLGDYWLA